AKGRVGHVGRLGAAESRDLGTPAAVFLALADAVGVAGGGSDALALGELDLVALEMGVGVDDLLAVLARRIAQRHGLLDLEQPDLELVGQPDVEAFNERLGTHSAVSSSTPPQSTSDVHVAPGLADPAWQIFPGLSLTL